MTVLFPDGQKVLEHSEIVVTLDSDQEMQHYLAVARKGQGPGELLSPNSVAIDSRTNFIYVAEGGLFHLARVSIFSENGEFISSFSHRRMKWPWGIAIHGDNVYVTDVSLHCIFHFKFLPDLRLIAKLGRRGVGIGQFNVPRQLTVSTKGDLFVTDYLNHRVKILGSDLHYRGHISNSCLNQPCDVKLTRDFVHVLCSGGSHCIHVFSYTGVRIRSVLSRFPIGPQVRSEFFCLDANENIIMSDYDDDQIKIFSKEGLLLHRLGEHLLNEGLFYEPYGIALTGSTKLVVVSRNIDFRLKILSY